MADSASFVITTEPVADDGIRYVSIHGDDENDGLTPIAAFRSVAAAVKSLPVTGEHPSNYRHSGKVIVGAGEFIETEPIVTRSSLIIEGIGTGTGGTWIKQGFAGDLITPNGDFDADFDDIQHWFEIRDVRLVGDQSIPGEWNLMHVRGGGFVSSIRNVMFAEASGYGLFLPFAGINFYGYNIAGTNCARGLIRCEYPAGLNLHNVGFWGVQADNCGTAPIQIWSDTGGDANVFFVSGLEVEGFPSSTHEAWITYETGASPNTNPVHFQIDNVSGYHEGATELLAIFYERDHGGPPARGCLNNIHLSAGHVPAFRSDRTGIVSQGQGLFPHHVSSFDIYGQVEFAGGRIEVDGQGNLWFQSPSGYRSKLADGDGQ